MRELKWEAPEFEYHHKGSGWVWMVVLITVFLMLVSLFTGNFLFAVFILMSSFLVIKWGQQKPEELEIRATDSGIDIEKKKFQNYDDLEGFAVRHIDFHKDGWAELIFRKKHHFGGHLKILIPKARVEVARQFINDYIPEIEYQDSLVDHIAKLLKF